MLNLYNKDFTTKYGAINSIIEAFVEEERNGLFELSFVMLNTDSLFKYIEEDNIVVANANNTLVNQKFRIYKTRKLMNNRVEVFARHISFDLMYDYIDNISFENQSCEYALNSLFRNSNFSRHYKGYSNIINAQNYSMSMANVLEAIGGKEGSLIDTFGTGAELLRDNENIHILNKRGYDNQVVIEYKKNLTGFELEEDTTELITRILPYAKYTPKDSEGNSLEETIVKASFVDSPLLANYSHPFIKFIDYTDKFEEDEEVTTSKLITFAQNEYRENKVDIPKQNFKIEFIPLSKCVGYEGLEDNISLCDTVTIKDTRYNINTQAKVIKVIFNVLKNRYESMELGEPKTSLGDIIGNNNSTKGEKGDKGDKGDKGEDGSIGDFPNSLPSTPVVTAKVYGFANIEISWTFENKVYYQYEVYASKEADFTPNTFNLIHSGQTSTYMYQAKPNETWYFKVCAINTHGDRTGFGNAYATTAKVDDLSNYVEEMAIDEALIGTLSLDRGWVGTLKGNHIDAKNLSVTNGNGKRTLDIDSYGNVSLDVASLKISSSNVATENYTDTKATQVLNESKTYTATQITATNNKVASIETNLDSITQRVSSNETTTTNINATLNKVSGGLNKWLFEVFDRGSITGTEAITLNNLVGKTPRQTLLVSEPLSTSNLLNEDNFLGRLTTNVYLDADYTWNATAYSDDGSSIYLNGNLIISMETCVTTNITMPFKKGWNKITWVFNERLGGDVAYFTPALSSLSQIKIIDAFSHTNIDEDKTILNSNITNTNNRVAEITTNLDSITQRVSSTESKVTTHTTQLGTVDSRINSATTNAINNAVGVKDTRNDNQPPSWYFTNYPTRTVEEFKYANKIGIGSSSVFGVLTTVVPWPDSSGGYPTQTFRSNSTPTYERKGTSATAWGAWTQVESTSGSQAKATQALNDAKAYTTTEVSKTNSKVATIETNLNGITQRVSNVETTSTQTINLAKAMSNGKILHTDVAFRKGSNNVNIYNNSGNGTVTVSRIAKISDCPTTSTHCLEIKTTGTASPGNGGFYQSIQSRANAIFIQKFIAKVPSGLTLNVASNSMGTGYTDKWLTSNKGTGKWEEYIREVRCGSTGTFSGGGHVYVSGASPSSSSPLVWYLASCTTYDITDSDERVTDLTTRMSSAESKITSSAIINTVSSTIDNKVNSAINTAKSQIKQTTDAIQSTVTNINDNYASKSQLTQTVNDFEYKFQQSKANLLYNSSGRSGVITPWHHFGYSNGHGSSSYINNDEWLGYETGFTIRQPNAHSSTDLGLVQSVIVTPNKPHTFTCYIAGHRCGMNVGITNAKNDAYISHSGYYGDIHGGTNLSNWHKITLHFTPSETQVHVRLTMTDSNGGDAYMWVKRCMLVEGTVSNIEWSPNPSEVMNNITNISNEGIRVSHNDGSYSLMSGNGFEWYNGSTGNRYHSLMYMGEYQCASEETRVVVLPSEFKGKPFKVVSAVKRISSMADLYIHQWPLLTFHAITENINHTNGTFNIYASVRALNYTKSNENSWGALIGDGSSTHPDQDWSERAHLLTTVAYWVFV